MILRRQLVHTDPFVSVFPEYQKGMRTFGSIDKKIKIMWSIYGNDVSAIG
jgi:hypothetical protein